MNRIDETVMSPQQWFNEHNFVCHAMPTAKTSGQTKPNPWKQMCASLASLAGIGNKTFSLGWFLPTYSYFCCSSVCLLWFIFLNYNLMFSWSYFICSHTKGFELYQWCIRRKFHQATCTGGMAEQRLLNSGRCRIECITHFTKLKKMSKSFESQNVVCDIHKQIRETMLQIVYEK